MLANCANLSLHIAHTVKNEVQEGLMVSKLVQLSNGVLEEEAAGQQAWLALVWTALCCNNAGYREILLRGRNTELHY